MAEDKITGTEKVAVTRSIGSIYQCTPGLRFVQDPRSDASPPVLQQAWMNLSDGTLDWRDVPTVMG